MREVIFIVGLPGSGKTTLLDKLRRPGIVAFDDFRPDDIETLKACHPADTVVISDPLACAVKPDNIRLRLESWIGPVNTHWLVFDNDLERCWDNIVNRADGRLISRASLRGLSGAYHPEQFSHDLIPVWYPLAAVQHEFDHRVEALLGSERVAA